MQEYPFAIKPFKESSNGLAIDLQAETRCYEELIGMHPIDFQILGIGRNGHIGFNEPGTPFNSLTHVVDFRIILSKPIAVFEKLEDVPKQAIKWALLPS